MHGGCIDRLLFAQAIAPGQSRQQRRVLLHRLHVPLKHAMTIQTHDAAASADWSPIMHKSNINPAHKAQDAHEPAPIWTERKSRTHRVLEAMSRAAGLCGHGKMRVWADGSQMTITAKIADYFWTECGCCWWWRGVFLGAAVGALITAAIAAIM